MSREPEDEDVSNIEEEPLGEDDPVDEDPREEDDRRVGVGRAPQQQASSSSASSKPRKPKKKVEQPPRGRIPKDADKSNEADIVWGRVIDELTEQGIDPAMVKIKVSRLDHGSPNGVAIGYIPGDEVVGDNVSTTPADALMHAIEDIHTNSATRGPQTYRISFMLRGQPYTSGTIRLASIEEISMRRRGMGALPPTPYQQQPGRAPLPPRPAPRGYDDRGGGGYDDRRFDDRRDDRRYDDRRDRDRGRYEEPHYDPEVQRMREDMRDIKETLRELMRTGVGAPQPPQPQGLTMDALTSVTDLLGKFGLHITPQQLHQGLGAAVAATPPPPAPLPPQQDDESQEFEKSITRKVRTAVNKKIDDAIQEVLDPKRHVAEEEEEEAKPPAMDEPPSDFEKDESVVWSKIPGTEIKYATNAETGETDWSKTGVGLAPLVIEKLGPRALDVASKFIDALQRPAQQQEMQGEVVPNPHRPRMNGIPAPQAPLPPPAPPKDDDFTV